MASAGDTLLRELWQGGGSVTTLQRGFPQHFPHRPQPRAQALQVPFNHPQCTPSSARLCCSGVPPSPWGTAAGWGRGGRACWCPQGPDHSLVSGHKYPPLPFVPPLALMCRFSSCSNGSSTFASVYAKKAAKFSQTPPP